ncbi:Hypothetical protein CINCED_3A015158 [Cinara cedri]|uniref:Uncharacterized protein n=1 Tax=Cinara cedri TaxID=506608 RepID=A0A5E4MF67_9HEMI|nr:Hypothetical protein CINCED_3A015158 [Cinara cedri]
MKFPYLCVFLLFAFSAVQTAPHIEELEKTMDSVFDSLFHIIRIPFIIVDKYTPLTTAVYGLYDKLQLLTEKLNEMTDVSLTFNGKKIKHKLQTIIPLITKLGNEQKENILSFTKVAFDKLPLMIQLKILQSGHNIDALLKQLRNYTDSLIDENGSFRTDPDENTVIEN